MRCLACSEKAGVVTLIDAGFSALTRNDEHRRFTRYSRERDYAVTKRNSNVRTSLAERR